MSHQQQQQQAQGELSGAGGHRMKTQLSPRFLDTLFTCIHLKDVQQLNNAFLSSLHENIGHKCFTCNIK